MARAHGFSLSVLFASLTLASACALQHSARTDGGPLVDNVDTRMTDGSDALDRVDVVDTVDVPVEIAVDVVDVTDTNTCPTLLCGTDCVDPAADIHHCGSCANDCAGLPHVVANSVRCSAGACDLNLACAAGFANCDGDASNGCETDLAQPSNCGACSVMCSGATPMCSSTSGSFSCTSGCVGATPDRCGATCVNLGSDVNNCNACGNVCPAGPNSTANCTARTCSITCATNFADCDNNPANGCEVDLRTDPLHCGGCATACAGGAQATPTCANRTCGLACSASFGNCDTNLANGCEASLSLPSSCGACGTICAGAANATATCNGTTCGFTCMAGNADCDGSAANGCEATLASDPDNCGACARACPVVVNATRTCTAGTCGSTCASGFVRSGSNCVPASTDTCPAGTGSMLADHASVVLIGTTVGSANNSRASCSSATAPDVAYAITPAANGVLTLRFSALYDGAVFVRSSCDPASSELSCATANFGVTTDTVNVTAGTTVIVWVDAIGGGAGSYALQVGLNVTCGNRAIDGGEQCDDGNNISGDGCSATCNVEVGRSDACPAGGAAGYPLANGPVWFGGNTNGLGAELVSSCVANGDSDIVYAITPTVSGTLRATVYPASAWNAQLYVRTACDTTPDVACANANPQGRQETVTLSVTAGTTYYVVVDGDTSGTAPGTGPFRLSLDIARCGDRVLQSGETCDDGNNVPNDGCDATCATEAMCRGMETEPNPFNAPNAITLPCATNDWFGSINPANDNDFYSVMTLTAGQVLDARTFIGSATQCGAATDTILELFRGPLASAPANNDCGGSGALVCNDDVFAGDLCSNVVYPVPSGGQYVLRTNSYRFGQTINNYGLQVIAR